MSYGSWLAGWFVGWGGVYGSWELSSAVPVGYDNSFVIANLVPYCKPD